MVFKHGKMKMNFVAIFPILLILESVLITEEAAIASNYFLPEHYDVQLQVTFEDKMDTRLEIPGKVKIVGLKRGNSSLLILDTKELEIDKDSIKVCTETDSCLEIQKIRILGDWIQSIWIDFKHPVKDGVKLEIEVKYTAHTRKSKNMQFMSAFLARYSLEEDETRFALFGSSLHAPNEGSRARALFPCVDDRSLTATVQLSLIRNSSMVSLTTTSLEQSTPHSENEDWVEDKFRQTEKVLLHSISFVVFSKEYDHEQVNFPDGRIIRVYKLYPNATKTVNPRKVAETAGKLMNFYESYFNESGKAGIKEMNIVILNMTGFYHLERQFGSLSIILDQHDQLDIKPGENTLASSLAYLWLGYQRGRYEVSIHHPIILHVASLAKQEIDMNSNLPVNFQLSLPTLISQPRWDGFSEMKWFETRVMSLIGMAEQVLTKETFRKALNIYAALSRGRHVSKEEFFGILQTAGEQDNRVDRIGKKYIKEMSTSWWDKPSLFPVISVNVVNETHVNFSQQEIKNNRGNQLTSLWCIPLNVITGDGLKYLLWLESNASSKILEHNISSSSLIVERGPTARYRVLYGGKVMEKIQDQLETDCSVFDALTRLQLLEDYFFFAENGYIDIISVYNISRYMDQEETPEIWDAFLSKIPLKSFQLLKSHPKYFFLERYLHDKIDAILARLQHASSEKTVMQKAFKLAVKFGTPLGVEHTREEFQKLLENFKATGRMRSDKYSDLGRMVRYGGMKAFDFFLDKQQNSGYRFTLENQNYQKYVLSQVSEPEVIQRLLQAILNRTLSFDVRTLLLSLVKEENILPGTIMQDELLSFFDENISKVGISYIYQTTKEFPYSTNGQRDKVLKFLDKHGEQFSGEFSDLESFIIDKTAKTLKLMETSGCNNLLKWAEGQAKKDYLGGMLPDLFFHSIMPVA